MPVIQYSWERERVGDRKIPRSSQSSQPGTWHSHGKQPRDPVSNKQDGEGWFTALSLASIQCNTYIHTHIHKCWYTATINTYAHVHKCLWWQYISICVCGCEYKCYTVWRPETMLWISPHHPACLKQGLLVVCHGCAMCQAGCSVSSEGSSCLQLSLSLMNTVLQACMHWHARLESWTLGLLFAWQALYPLSPFPSPNFSWTGLFCPL